jgi:hypothetical protein
MSSAAAVLTLLCQPKTSVHPDAKLMVPVHVTRFVTEAEYAELAAQKRLGWQEAEREEERERLRLAEIERAEAERRVMDERSVRTPKVSASRRLLSSGG